MTTKVVIIPKTNTDLIVLKMAEDRTQVHRLIDNEINSDRDFVRILDKDNDLFIIYKNDLSRLSVETTHD